MTYDELFETISNCRAAAAKKEPLPKTLTYLLEMAEAEAYELAVIHAVPNTPPGIKISEARHR